MRKTIKKRVVHKCSICGKEIRVIVYADRSYRGGHRFGKIPLISKKEWEKAKKFGTHTFMLAGMEMQVMNKDPRPYAHVEYWECPKCYWGGK